MILQEIVDQKEEVVTLLSIVALSVTELFIEAKKQNISATELFNKESFGLR